MIAWSSDDRVVAGGTGLALVLNRIAKATAQANSKEAVKILAYDMIGY